MAVRVRLYGALRRLSSPETRGLWQGEVPPGTTIEALIHLLGTKPGEVYVASINGALQPFDTVIPDNAEVILAPPIGGGATVTPGPILPTHLPHAAACIAHPCVRQERP